MKYATGEEELYDLYSDPYQLTNQAGNASDAAVLDQMRTRLATLCDPPPPGFP